MEKAEEGLIKCSECPKTWPRYKRNEKGRIISGPGEAMAKLQWHFETEHGIEYARLQGNPRALSKKEMCRKGR